MKRRIDLITDHKLRRRRQRLVHKQTRGCSEQPPGCVTARVLLDDPAWVLWVAGLVITIPFHGLRIQQCQFVEMVDEHRVIRRHRIQFRNRRQTLFLELELGESPGDANELASRRSLSLFTEQVKRLLKAVDTVPTHLEVIVYGTADRMSVAVVKAWDDALSTGIDHLSERADQVAHLVVRTYGHKHAVACSQRSRFRACRVHGGYSAVEQHKVGGVRLCMGGAGACETDQRGGSGQNLAAVELFLHLTRILLCAARPAKQ